MTFFSSTIVCVPTVENLKEKIMTEAHHTRNADHPGANKMYQNLKNRYWWSNIKIDRGFHFEMLDTQPDQSKKSKDSQVVMPAGNFTMEMERYHDGFYFRTSTGYDVFWVIIDPMTKSAHFLPMRTTSTMDMLAKMYGV